MNVTQIYMNLYTSIYVSIYIHNILSLTEWRNSRLNVIHNGSHLIKLPVLYRCWLYNQKGFCDWFRFTWYDGISAILRSFRREIDLCYLIKLKELNFIVCFIYHKCFIVSCHERKIFRLFMFIQSMIHENREFDTFLF